MSRIGRLPVVVPEGVNVKVNGTHVLVKGPKGELDHVFPASMQIAYKDGQIEVNRPSDDRDHRSMHGMTRALINNMVVGVSTGFEKVLEVNGVGYRAEMQGKNLVLNVGYSHPVVVEPPEGISFEVDMKVKSVSAAAFGFAERKAIYREGCGCTIVNGLTEDELRQQKLGGVRALRYLPEQRSRRPWPARHQGYTRRRHAAPSSRVAAVRDPEPAPYLAQPAARTACSPAEHGGRRTRLPQRSAPDAPG